MKELSVGEHAWLARYERKGIEGMGDRSHRPTDCPIRGDKWTY
jgi:hypothetical protein